MKELLLFLGVAGAAIGFKKYKDNQKEPTPLKNPFGPSGCRLNWGDLAADLNIRVRPKYLAMRPEILAYPVMTQTEEHIRAFHKVWRGLSDTVMAQHYGAVLEERGCSQEDFNRAYEEVSGMIACMMVQDLSSGGSPGYSGLQAAVGQCDEDPPKMYRALNEYFANVGIDG